jgi:hypothetical protein
MRPSPPHGADRAAGVSLAGADDVSGVARQMKRVLLILFAIVAILGAVIVAWIVRIDRRLAKSPRTIEKPFASWGDGWNLPAMQPAKYDAYWVVVRYDESQPGRLATPLRLKIIDETTGETIPTEWHGGRGGAEFVIVTKFDPVERCRYRIEVDPEQVKELVGHRLKIMPTHAELNNWIGNAVFK